MRLIQITDLHLSDRQDTPAADALRWAITESNRSSPDLVTFTGDMTTYGTEASARHFLEQAGTLTSPWVFTPGNAELRDPGAQRVLAECTERRSMSLGGVRFLLPDTSCGRISPYDREWLTGEGASDTPPRVLLTHYPIDVLEADSRSWIEAWLQKHPVEMYLAGHRHFSRSRSVSGCWEVITRGLDPDKAFDGPPGICLFERKAGGDWSQTEIPWPHEHSLLPAATDQSPVGWSIHGDPLETVKETRQAGQNALELRPRELDYDLSATVKELDALRQERPVYLSWHLPNLKWISKSCDIDGRAEVSRQIDDARACGVDSFTVHVPRITAAGMYGVGDEPADAWRILLDCYHELFRESVEEGIRVSIENIHNQPGTPADRASREFGTEIGECLAWIDAVAGSFDGAGRVGAHFDVGHARNNGELGNLQPIGDWYARIGSRITGYHIHQVRPHEETGKLTNHRDIKDIYDRTVSYAGFLHAWSKRLINREPLFIEVRIAEERRRTTRLFQEIFS